MGHEHVYSMHERQQVFQVAPLLRPRQAAGAFLQLHLIRARDIRYPHLCRLDSEEIGPTNLTTIGNSVGTTVLYVTGAAHHLRNRGAF